MNKYLHGVNSVGIRTKDVMIYFFPVTSMIFRYVIAQPIGVLRSRGKEKAINGDSTLLEGYDSETAKTATLAALTMRDSANKLVRDTQLRQLLSVTTRVVPILKLVRPLQKWQRGDFVRKKDTVIIDVELEKDRLGLVHVGDSERFYDLWKDENKSKKGTRDGARVDSRNFESDANIGDYSPNFSFDEEAVSDSMKTKGQGVSLPGGSVRGTVFLNTCASVPVFLNTCVTVPVSTFP
jgi:hypothetical protein